MGKSRVFVIMPFSDDFFESYEMLKSNFENDFEFSHAGDVGNQQNILADIIPPIYSADIILADLTNLNPNVMYELGIAHSFNKKTIIITRDDLGDLPFDLKQYRAVSYSTHFKKFYELLTYLDKNFHGAIDGSVIFSNPVRDFFDKNQVDPTSLFAKEQSNIYISNNEDGFLDFLADIEEDMRKITINIQNMQRNLNVMNAGMRDCIAKIQNANGNGGSGTAAFVRKQTRKAAEYISTFSKQLKEHNETNSLYFEKIQVNTLGLLENQYAAKEENRVSLIDYLKSLYGMQKAIRASNESIEKLQKTSLNNLGLERSMNQSIRFLDEDLSTYLTIINQMDAAIDRILAKSKFIVGEIDFSQEV